ncbi:MAG: bifunctional folylpolyglutamate synthase/dihydrofolate synthase [Paramuribaculum sp.]|nr:bifunctional folylpolyglutamate synthase/dihydrofolate synthase [Paramuribaculum sp.]
MNYADTLEFLYNSMPAFERQGSDGYKPGLERVKALAEAFGNPHKSFPCVHIAGTNGKGSTAHLLAAIMQCAGYRTGLFTSPHLEHFEERIRIDGRPITQEQVVEFVDRYRAKALDIEPSFFELTTVMGFDAFAAANVDIAIVETGLGGRLDSTNIVDPLLSLITNVDFDHTDLLGDTLEAIAREKAGIIKPGRPVVVSEANGIVRSTFEAVAQEKGARVSFAEDCGEIIAARPLDGEYETNTFGQIESALTGQWQVANARGVLEAVRQLRQMGYIIPDNAMAEGFLNVVKLTGLRGRWTERELSDGVRLVYDTGHNPAGWRYIVDRLSRRDGRVHLLLGFVADKDVSAILRMLAEKMPADTVYHLTQPDSHRALHVEQLAALASAAGIAVTSTSADPIVAYEKAKEGAAAGDTLYVGGSNYLIGGLLSSLSPQAHP